MRKITTGMTVAGRYTITGLLGRGGSGDMYRARDIVMNRTVALKVISAGEEQLSRKSFLTEIKAASALAHPGIVNIYDQVSTEDACCIVMEYVCGITLRDYIDFHGRLSLKECVACTRQVLGALHAAHSKGIVHRDIKPGNLMIATDGRVKVTDFGIARLPGKDGFLMPDRTVGTVHYISPEQAAGNAVDERSDLYSLGVVMYEMLTGQVPFDAERVPDVAMMQISTKPTPPSAIRKDLPPELEQIVLCALEKDPAARFDSAAAMRDILDRLPDSLLLGHSHPMRADGESYRVAAESDLDRTGEIKLVKRQSDDLGERSKPEKKGREATKDAEKKEEKAPTVASKPVLEEPVSVPESGGVTPVSPKAEQVLGRFTAKDTVDILLPVREATEEAEPVSPLPREEDLIRRESPEEEEPLVLMPLDDETCDLPKSTSLDEKQEIPSRSDVKKTLPKKRKKRTSSSVFDNQGYRTVALLAAAVLLLVLLISLIKKEEPAQKARLPEAPITEVLRWN